MPNVSNLSDALEQVERMRRTTLYEFGYRSNTNHTTNDEDEEEETTDSSLLLSAADFLAPPAMDLNEDTELMHRGKDAVTVPAKVTITQPRTDPSYYNFINTEWMLQIKNSVRSVQPPPPPSIENLNLYGATSSSETADSGAVVPTTASPAPDLPSDRNLPKFVSENLASNECVVAAVVAAATPTVSVPPSDASGAHHFNQQSTGSHRSNHSNSNSVYSNSNEISSKADVAKPQQQQQHAVVSLNNRPKLYEFREKKWSLFHSLIAESSGEFIPLACQKIG